MATVGSVGKKFEKPESGEYSVKLIGLEAAEKEYQGKVSPAFKLTFETTKAKNKDGEPYRIFYKPGVTFGDDRARLTAMIRSIFDRAPSPEEFCRLDLELLIGEQYKVLVETSEKDDKTS